MSRRAIDRQSTPQAEAFLSAYTPAVRATALALRRLVLELAPDAIEQIDLPVRMLAYGFARTYKGTICVIMPLKEGVNLGFPRGTELADPAGLLVGSGKKARHVRITDAAQVAKPELRSLIMQSIKIARR